MKRRTFLTASGFSLTTSGLLTIAASSHVHASEEVQRKIVGNSRAWHQARKQPPNIVTFPRGVSVSQLALDQWRVRTIATPYGTFFFDRDEFLVNLIISADVKFEQILEVHNISAVKSQSYFIDHLCNLNFGLNAVYLRFAQPEITDINTIKKMPVVSRSIPVSDIKEVIIQS